MKLKMKISLALLISVTATLTTAQQQSICRAYGFLQWQCDVCGSALYNSAPVGCVPFNATFTSLPATTSSATFYSSSAKWTNFSIIKPAALSAKVVPPQLQARSRVNYARVKAGRKGVLAFENGTGDGNGTAADTESGSKLMGLGNLWSFWYGCTEAGREGIPTPCTITVKSDCVPISDLINGTITTFAYNLTFTPAVLKATGYANTSLAFWKGDVATDARQVCYSYTLSARGARTGVDLVVDDVWLRALRRR